MRGLEDVLQEVVKHVPSFLDERLFQVARCLLGRKGGDVAAGPSFEKGLAKSVEITEAPELLKFPLVIATLNGLTHRKLLVIKP